MACHTDDIDVAAPAPGSGGDSLLNSSPWSSSSQVDSCAAIMLEKSDRTEGAMLELAASLKAAEEGEVGADREREEVQAASEAAVRTWDSTARRAEEAESRAEVARLQAAQLQSRGERLLSSRRR